LVRWAAVEAVQRVPAHTRLGRHRDRVGERRGHNAGVVAAGREVVVLVFYGLRDHRIRYLPARPGPGRREHAWRTRGRRGSFRVMTPAPGLIGCGVVAPCD
jgi:hypothetical protein